MALAVTTGDIEYWSTGVFVFFSLRYRSFGFCYLKHWRGLNDLLDRISLCKNARVLFRMAKPPIKAFVFYFIFIVVNKTRKQLLKFVSFARASSWAFD